VEATQASPSTHDRAHAEVGPRVSVIIPTYNASASIETCLRSLLAGSYRDFEVLVVDSSTDGTAEIVAERFPGVQLHRLPRRAFPGDARNFAIARARGELLAFLDADCVADPGWLEAIERAHRGPVLAVGGTIDNANPESYVAWASYFCKFSQWMPQRRARPMGEIPTCCLSVKRPAFASHGPFPEGTLSSDTAFNWRLTRAGHAPWLDPMIKVAHINRDRFRVFLSNLMRHGRDFARVRAREERFSNDRLLAFVLLSPLLPPLLFVRTAARVLRHRRYVREFVRAAPVVMLGHAAWSLGELRGYGTSLRARGGA
jgi:glycosyltransferase involved in cell wall biosynthesis